MAGSKRGFSPLQWGVVLVLVCLLTSISAAAGKLVAAKEPGWPQWRGPKRDGVSTETGLLQAWPKDGPKRLWTKGDIGRGYSSPIVSRGGIYITGDVGDELHIFALALDGKPKWKVANGKAWKRPTPGSRSSCRYDEGRLYHMNAHGRAVCLDAKTGKEIWTVNVLQRFEGKNITWGLSESLLVDSPAVIVTPAGKKGLMAALDKKTGKTLWTTEPLTQEQASYGSPILVDRGGRRQLIAAGSRHTFAVDAKSGKLLWTFRHVIETAVIVTTPVFHDGSVFVTNCERDNWTFYRLRIDADDAKAEKVWAIRLSTSHESVICVGDHLYGSSDRGVKGWVRVDPASGKVTCSAADLPAGACIWADGRLYCLTNPGEVLLLKEAGDRFETAGRFELVKAKKKDAWAHPVICDGRLYLRYHETLYCYDIRN